MNFYHATDLQNAKAIRQDGLKPSWDGYVHLTTNPNKALTFLAMRPNVDAVVLFTVRLPKKKVESFVDGTLSGDDCYVHEGAILRGKVSEHSAYRLIRQGGRVMSFDRMTPDEYFSAIGA